jgi:hypothetical protein
MSQSAQFIPVLEFRTILFWPLILESQCEPAERPKIIEEQLQSLTRGGAWKQVHDLLDHIPPPTGETTEHDALCYNELTYFHEFVQNFLYARKAEDGPTSPMQLFHRTDITEVDIIFTTEQETLHFPMQVGRLNLYVIAELGIALLAIETNLPSPGDQRARVRFCDISKADAVAAGDFRDLLERPLTLADVVRFNDAFRRAHAPYLTKALKPPVGDGTLPRAVRWGARGEPFDLLRTSPNGDSESAEIAKKLRHGHGPRPIPPFRHFAHLLDGWRLEAREGTKDSWRHLADDRLPVLSYICLPNRTAYRSISFGDWVRICFLDGPASNTMPYASEFLRKDWDRYVYDRFHYESADSSLAPSRYLISGYSLVAVGSEGFFRHQVSQHMRRQYFQLMLLGQIERAALLSISSGISRAVRLHDSDNGPPLARLESFEKRLQAAEGDFLRFIHRFRFTGVSEQLQPTELFAIIRRNMRLPELFADLKDELTTATDFLGLLNQQRQTANATRLSVVATFGVILGLAFAMLGANLTSAESVGDLLKLFAVEAPRDGWVWAAALGVVAITIGGCFLAARGLAQIALPRRQGTEEDPIGNRLRRQFGAFGGFGLCIGATLLSLAAFPPIFWGLAGVSAAVLMILWLMRAIR